MPLTIAGVHIEHLAEDPGDPTPYRHVQDLLFAELPVTIARGLPGELGVEIQAPLRVVRERIRYQDLAGRPHAPAEPDIHHRNETTVGPGDARVVLHRGFHGTPWSAGLRAGVSVPLGRTEANPFELGRLGRRHRHVQFGTGTWDPVLGAAVGRPLGGFAARLEGLARLVLAENRHGYRAGHRYHLHLGAARELRQVWALEGGLTLAREEAERWDGRVEEEGNLGRTDLLVSVAAGRDAGPWGRLVAGVQVALHSHVSGHQADLPVMVNLRWSP